MAGVHRKRQHEEDSSEDEPTQQRAHPLLFQRPNEPAAEQSVYPGPSGLQNVVARSHYRPSSLRPPPSKRWQDRYIDLREALQQQMGAEFMKFLNTFGPRRRSRPMTPRPKKCGSNFKYQPGRIFHGDTSVTVSVLRHDPSIYSPSLLAFNETSTALEFKIRATTTLYRMKQAQEGGLRMRAAILGLYLVRHSVCILNNNWPVHHLDNAVKSFPNDVLGKWCFPSGETVIMVNFYADQNCVNTALMNLVDAMKAIDELDGEYTSSDNHSNFRNATLEDHQACLIEGENNFKVITPEPLSRIFKPVFTQKFYLMDSVKNRMAAELLQAAILIFIHMIEKTLTSDNVGGALYLAQCMHRCSLLLRFLLPDESVTDHYLFTMPNWYLGRCYVLTATKWLATWEAKADQHTDAQNMLGEFHVRFFGRLLTAYNTKVPMWCSRLHRTRSFYFPKTITECFSHASAAFNTIQAPKRWQRTRLVELCARAIHNHLQLIKFEKKIAWTRNKVEKNARRNEILEICEDVHYILNFSIQDKNCKVFLLNLLAKSLKYRAACLSLNFFIRRTLSKYEVGRLPYVDLAAKKQSMEQQCALALFNKACQNTCYKGSRQVLLQMSEITFADGILSQIHAADEQYVTSGIAAITRLLPAVFAMWVRKLQGLEQHSPQINVMDIPDFEIQHLFNIMGMMYNGTAMLYCLMARGVQDIRYKEDFMNNAKYFHALSCIYMQRSHVTYFILRAYTDYNLKYERCLLNSNYTAENIPKGSTLALSLLFNYLLVLPVLWELCARADRIDGPQNCENIAINHMMLPIPLDKIPGSSTENEKRLYSDVLEHLRAEAAFEEGDEMIVSHTSTSEPTLLTYAPHDFSRDASTDAAVREFPNSRDSRPMVWGNDDCTTSQECPVEQYHYEDELKFKTYDNFWIARYPTLFSKIDENKRTPVQNLRHQLQRVSRSLYKIMSKAIHEVNNLRDETPQNISVTINVDGGQHTTNIPVERALFHLYQARDLLLKSRVSTLASITQALARVDEALNEGRTLLMLRGRINTEE